MDHEMKCGQSYICSECGKEITGEYIFVKTQRGTKMHIHYACVSSRRRPK